MQTLIKTAIALTIAIAKWNGVLPSVNSQRPTANRNTDIAVA
jgi:hypothetical protein